MGPWEPSAPAFNNQRARIVELSYFYPHLIDASFSHFSHEIDQVLPDVKDWMQAMGKSLDPRPVRTYFRYKYLLDIDGNSCTYSWFRWILFSNSTPLKVLSNNIQWYYGALVPFEHYIPIKEDFSDLVEMINFLKEHDDDAKAVAQNGQKIAREIFSQEKVDEYTVKLLRAYAKLFN